MREEASDVGVVASDMMRTGLRLDDEEEYLKGKYKGNKNKLIMNYKMLWSRAWKGTAQGSDGERMGE